MDGYFLGDGAGAGDAASAPSHCAAAAAKLASLSAEVAYTADSTTWRLKHRSTMTGARAGWARGQLPRSDAALHMAPYLSSGSPKCCFIFALHQNSL